MRTTALAPLFGLVLVACAGQIDGGGGGGDDDILPDSCGNQAIDQGEGCDDGNNTDGDGCSATCQVELQPRIDATVDKTTVATELGKSETLTLTLTSIDGFAGPVDITTAIVDANNAPVAALTLAGPSTIDLAADQVSPAQYTLAIPSNATGTTLSATVKIDVVASVGTKNLTSAVTVEPRFTIEYKAGTGTTAANHPVLSGTQARNVTVKRGTIIRFANNDTIQHDTHGGGIFDHQGAGQGQPGTAYEQPTIGAAPGTSGVLGCHETGHGGDAGYVTFTVE